MSRVLVFALMLLPASAWAAGYILEAAGSVTVAAGKSVPKPVVKYEPVTSGTVVRTGDNSHAVLKFEDGQVVSMQANSTFQVREYSYEPKQVEKSNITFSMFKGGMRFVTGLIGQTNPRAFRLATPHATIGIRGTDFLVVMANNATYSQVVSGSISVTNAAGLSILSAGQTGLTPSAATLTTTLPSASVPAGTFSQVAAIPVPAPVPAPIPAPVPAGAAASTGTTAAAGTTGTTAGTAAATTTAAGGAAAGGAAASAAAAAGGVLGGVSATTIGVGIGVAAVAAAVVNSTTTHH